MGNDASSDLAGLRLGYIIITIDGRRLLQGYHAPPFDVLLVSFIYYIAIFLSPFDPDQ